MCDDDEVEYEAPEPEEVPSRRDEEEAVVDSMAETMDEAASAAEAGLYDGRPQVPEGQRLVDEGYIEQLEQRERDREWDERYREERMKERARAHLKDGKKGPKGHAGPGAPRKKRGWVKWVVISVVVVVGGIVGLGIWGAMMAKEAAEELQQQANRSLAAATAAATKEEAPPPGPVMATKEECEQMMRNGTLIKSRLKRRFRRLSKARQQRRLDRVMKSPKMVTAVEECTSRATKKLAECIIAAKNHTEFKACRDVE